ncbi:hypothetical protein H0H81_002500 [Sphagnurus paluster]|uniref:C2H2-type domain-containing protein n=1 Tax=Sphagnurus paluster TaxID=117069 RepID=A0A9P7GHD4_9AGAR|nr:hypothetical protein H0H81_002500 [Sphagnurus paluster]
MDDTFFCCPCKATVHMKLKDSHLDGKKHARRAGTGPLFICTICGLAMTMKSKDTHLRGKKHRERAGNDYIPSAALVVPSPCVPDAVVAVTAEKHPPAEDESPIRTDSPHEDAGSTNSRAPSSEPFAVSTTDLERDPTPFDKDQTIREELEASDDSDFLEEDSDEEAEWETILDLVRDVDSRRGILPNDGACREIHDDCDPEIYDYY